MGGQVRILFLDDDKHRQKVFAQLAIGAVVDYVETAAACIEKLQEQRYDLVCLDHDLGGETYVDTNREDCGMEVVRWFEQHPDVQQGYIICHTFNQPAGIEMFQRLSWVESIRRRLGNGMPSVVWLPFNSNHYQSLVKGIISL